MTAETPTEEPDPDRHVGVEARKNYAAKLRDGFIRKYLSGPAILDIGYRGYEADVLPIVPQAIGIDLDYPGYDGRTLPFADGSQDAVFSSHCLEHAEDCRAAIAEWFRVVKTDGYLIVAVPHKYLYERRATPPSRWNTDHRRFFTPATLLLRVEEALEPNSYRVRHLVDNDFAYVYSIPPEHHPGGCYEIELVIQKIWPPSWQLENLDLAARTPPQEPLHLIKSENFPDVSGLEKKKIMYDGLNLGLSQGTGIATYTRILTHLSHNLKYEVGVLYETPFTPPDDAILQDVLFFDQARSPNRSPYKGLPNRLIAAALDNLQCHFSLKPAALKLGGTVAARQFADLLPTCDRAFAAKKIFDRANRYFDYTGRFVRLSFDPAPNIFHCTYVIPLSAKNSYNIYTIHDLVPLRLPYGTMDDKERIYRLLKTLAAKADHIVTVSENSKRDIIELLGIEESRVTNTYQTVVFPEEYLSRSDEMVANYLDGMHGLGMRGYLLFFGALEPKKNVGRLIDAYLSSGTDLPLVLVTAKGWQNASELGRLSAHQSRANATEGRGPTIRCLDYVSMSNLVNLIRGARAVVFPSLYEGFGLPVLEAMTLGTPVVTSSSGALAEIAGDAALLADPYDVDDIARAIATVANDLDLCGELSQRGLLRAKEFSPARYQERVEALYASLS